MFGFGKKSTTVIKAPAPAVPERPRRQKIRYEEPDEVESYVTLCKEIGAETPAVRMLQLRQFLAERGIPEYNGHQVHQYLLHLAKTQVEETGLVQRIFWYPLRKDDLGDQHPLWYAWGDVAGMAVFIQYQSNTLYHKLVPASALGTVQTILKAFPDAKFFVSDIAQVADPFLAVTIPGQALMIVDFWDEPGFRPITTK